MDLKVIIIIAFTYLYGFFEILIWIIQRKKTDKIIEKKGDKGSFWIMFILIAIGYSLSFDVGSTKTGRMDHWDTFFIIGVVLAIIGLFIRISSILTLKQHFTYNVTKIEGHELIETGLYKWIRHPGYLGQLIIFEATAIALSNWLSVILMLIPVFIGYYYRIRAEEKFMIVQWGLKYLEYQKRTKRLIPWIY
jgi:protein-S-isoprenylcysteine O-methyltransferase Ste14